MFTTTVTYKDFNDKQHTEQLYFHIMVTELVDLEFDTNFEDGGLSTYIRNTMNEGDGRKIYALFKLLIVQSYGRRSEDGSEFIKSPEITKKFMASQAYDEFFMWLVLDPKNAEKFFLGIMPGRLSEYTQEVETGNSGKKKIQDMSREELVEMMQKRIETKSADPVV